MDDPKVVHCLYCNTKFVYRSHLGKHETDPLGNFFEDEETN